MIEYVEPIVLGMLAGQTGGVVSVVHAKLQEEVKVAFPTWANVLAVVGSVFVGLIAAGVAGYVIEGPRAAIWSLCGGIIGPQVWPDFRKTAIDIIAKKVR